MVGILLAAGLGTRLRPHTEKIPKPLIPCTGIEPLFYNIYRFYKMGIRNIVINTHYLPEQIGAAVKLWLPKFFGLQIRIIHEDTILGTGGSITNIVRKYSDWFKDSGLIVQNADTVSNISYTSLLNISDENGAIGISFHETHLAQYKPLWVDQGNYRGIGVQEPTPTAMKAHMLGVHSLGKNLVQKILKDAEFECKEIDLFNGIYKILRQYGSEIEAHEIFHPKDCFWFDLGTEKTLLEAQEHIFTNLHQIPDWIECLKWRHPGILERSKGVWTTVGLETINFRIVPPIILSQSIINSSKEFNTSVVGPFVSICTSYPEDSVLLEGHSTVHHAVVVLSDGKGKFPTHLENKIFISS